MLKRQCCSSVVLKRHGWWSVELVPDDVVEVIMEMLPVKTLVRLTCVSKKWKSTIESRHFQKEQLSRRMRSRGPDVILVDLYFPWDDGQDTDAQRMVFGSSIVSRVRLPSQGNYICHGSCEGVICIYATYTPSFVVNPVTRWFQTFPHSNFQQLLIDSYDKGEYDLPNPRLGFGKDKVRGTYKPVWLYNSSEYGLDDVTTCEVFDFSSNAWRYIHPASPHRINVLSDPMYLDGSLYWLTEGKETKVLSLDLDAETFQVLCKAPLAPVRGYISDIMCILDNRLCVSETNWPTQVIWSLDYYSKTWKKLGSIDLTATVSWFIVKTNYPLVPIAILDKDKLLLQGRYCTGSHMIYDLHAKSFDLPKISGYPVYYFQSLFSALSN